jgi:hypothetical protein
MGRENLFRNGYQRMRFVMPARSFLSLTVLRSLLALNTVAHAAASAAEGWFPFDPKPDPFTNSPIDLRFLNENFAGEHGFIAAKDGHFTYSANGQPGAVLGRERNVARRQ